VVVLNKREPRPKYVSLLYIFTNYMHIIKLVPILNEILQYVSVFVPSSGRKECQFLTTKYYWEAVVYGFLYL
jgi:hypothetical protein